MKNKNIQRILAVALSTQLMLSCMGTAAFATDGGDRFEKDGLTYSVLTAPSDNAPGTVQVGNGWGSMSISKPSVVIPETVTNDANETYTVVAIGKYAFYNGSGETSVKSVEIPATVTSIGKNAFTDLSALNSVTFAKNSQLKTIGDNAFDSTSISSISLPASLKTIGEAAFTKCRYLSSVTMQEGVAEIGASAFSSDRFLSSITLPASLTTLGSGVFDGCSYLKSITVTEGSKTYSSNDGVLFNADQTTLLQYPAAKDATYTVPDSVTAIGDYAFANNTKITDVVLPDGVKSIGKYAFSKATNLKSLELGNSLETIGTLAFWNCSKLEKLTIPATVTSIGSTAFYNCYDTKFEVPSDELKKMVKSAGASEDNITVVAPSADVTFAVDGVTYKVLTEPANGQNGTVQIGDGDNAAAPSAAGTLTIPATVSNDGKTYSVVSVAYAAFMNSELTAITLPEGITSIGGNAFRDSAVTSFAMPSAVAEIGEYSFSSETLSSITISGSLSKIPTSAFSGSGLRTVSIPEGVTEIGNLAFNSCGSLQTVALPATLTTIQTRAFWCDEALREVTIAQGSQLKTVGENAFQWCSTLKSIQLPDTLETIEQGAFSNCTKLNSIGLTENSQLKVLGAEAFSSTAITSFYYPATLTTIGTRPLGSCGSLTEITVAEDHPNYKSIDGVLFSKDGTTLIQYPANKKAAEYTTPAGVKTIDTYAFQGTSSRLKEIIIGDGVETVKAFAFQNSQAESISIADSVTSMEKLCFYKCPYLETIKLPSGMNTLVSNLVWSCDSLTALTVPTSVVKIESSAVSNCPNLSSIEILAADVTSIGSNAFSSLSSALKVTVVNDTVKALVVASGVSEDQVIVKSVTPPTPGDTTFTINGVLYQIITNPADGKNGTVQIGDGTNGMTASGVVTIPAVVQNGGASYDVVSVAYNALKGSAVTELRLPASVKALADHALYGASELLSFEIPSGVESIGVNAIAGCPKLKAITYQSGSNLKKLDNGALSDNSVLETVALPNTLVDIGTYTMFYNYKLREVTFEAGAAWTELPEGTFARDAALERVTLPSSVTSIGYQAFWNCGALAQIDLSHMNEIGAQAFYHCTTLASITLSDSLEKLESGTFEGCTSLTSVQLGSGLKTLGDLRQTGEEDLTGVFEGCTALTSIQIPAATTVIGKNAFKDCGALSKITILAPALSEVGANAFYGLAEDYMITVQNEAVKDTLVNTALVEASHIRVGTGEDPTAPKVTLTDKGSGGLGKLAQVTVTNARVGAYLLVQITNAAGVNSVYAVPVPQTGSMDISCASGNHVQVWLTERQPEMTAGMPNAGGQVFGSAAL